MTLYDNALDFVAKDHYCYGQSMTKWVREIGGSGQYPQVSLFHICRRLFTVDVDNGLTLTCECLDWDAGMIRRKLIKLGVPCKIRYTRHTWTIRMAGVTSALFPGLHIDLAKGHVTNPRPVVWFRAKYPRTARPSCQKEIRGEGANGGANT